MTTTKSRTITLTDRPPVRITDAAWPVVALGAYNEDDSDGRGNRANRTTTREIRVRQHADGRAIVSGIYDHSTCYQGERDHVARRGVLLEPSVGWEQIIDAIRVVGRQLAEAEDDAEAEWRTAVQACIADLPAEEL